VALDGHEFLASLSSCFTPREGSWNPLDRFESQGQFGRCAEEKIRFPSQDLHPDFLIIQPVAYSLYCWKIRLKIVKQILFWFIVVKRNPCFTNQTYRFTDKHCIVQKHLYITKYRAHNIVSQHSVAHHLFIPVAY
jgi:hypothetical protein